MGNWLIYIIIINLFVCYLLFHFERLQKLKLKEDEFIFRLKIWLILRGLKNV